MRMRVTDSRLDTKDLEAMLQARGYTETIFSDVKDKKTDANEKRIRGRCPYCNSKDMDFSASTEKPVWSCNRKNDCGRRGNWYTYLKDQGRVSDYRDYVRLLADAAGVEIPEADQKRYEAYIHKSSLMETAMAYFKDALQTEAGREVKDYLLGRGYSEEEISSMNLGAYVGKAGLRKALTSSEFSPDDIKDSGLMDTKHLATENKLAIPVPDVSGRIVGITFRQLGDGQPKYVNTAGMDRGRTVTGMETAKGSKKKILVEGYMDAHYLNYLAKEAGLKEPIVALGASEITEDQIRAVEMTGTEELILALDTDTAGLKGTADAIDKLRLRGSDIRIYVARMDELMPEAEKVDPDSLVRARGIKAFVEACDRSESWCKWYAGWIVYSTGQEPEVDISSDRGRDILLRRLARVYADLEDGQDKIRFMEPLAELNITIADLDSMAEEARKEKAEERIRQRVETLKSQLSGGLSGREIENLLRAGLQDISVHQARPLEPYTWRDFTADMLDSKEGLLTGYTALEDKYIRIPRGAITLIAGRPGQGKTTLQLNLLLKMLEMYPDQSFYFFSYEEHVKRLTYKLLKILSGDAGVRYLRQEEPEDEDMEKAIETLRRYMDSGRLVLNYDCLRAGDLANRIKAEARRHDIGAVFVDYIQRIAPQEPQSLQYLNMKDVSSRILEASVETDLPIILGAQLGRSKDTKDKVVLENLRESGDFEQDANLVLGLLCKAVQDKQDEGGEAKETKVELDIWTLKNREGQVGVKMVLDWDLPVLRIMDKVAGREGLM